MKFKDLKKIEETKEDRSKYKNAKRILKVHKEYPDFLWGLESENSYSNDKAIIKKFNKIIKDYKITWYQCPECHGQKRFSVDAGHDAWGKPETDIIDCDYCNAEGKISKEFFVKKQQEERKEYKDELKRLKKKIKEI